jgi:hypothetical protein
MSEVKITPFSFGESDEDIAQVQADTLPGATEPKKEEEDKSQKTEKEEVKPEKGGLSFFDPGEEETDDEEDASDSLGLFGDKPKKEEKVEDKKISTEEVEYSAIKDFLIENGIWQDWEGSESTELNAETFQKLWEAQAENKAKHYVTEEVSQFGETASQLMEYLKAGGDVNQFLDNHNQQLDVASIDVTSEDGQEKAISTFYESIGKSKEWIKKQINRLKDDGEDTFKEEAEDCIAKLKEELDSQRQELIKEQQQAQKERVR